MENAEPLGIKSSPEIIQKSINEFEELRIHDEINYKAEEITNPTLLMLKRSVQKVKKHLYGILSSEFGKKVGFAISGQILGPILGGDPALASNDPKRINEINQACERINFKRELISDVDKNCLIKSIVKGINNANGMAENNPEISALEEASWVSGLRDEAVAIGFERTGLLGISNVNGRPDSKLRKLMIDNLDNYILNIWIYDESNKAIYRKDFVTGVNAEGDGVTPVHIHILYDNSHFDPLFIKNDDGKSVSGKIIFKVKEKMFFWRDQYASEIQGLGQKINRYLKLWNLVDQKYSEKKIPAYEIDKRILRRIKTIFSINANTSSELKEQLEIYIRDGINNDFKPKNKKQIEGIKYNYLRVLNKLEEKRRDLTSAIENRKENDYLIDEYKAQLMYLEAKEKLMLFEEILVKINSELIICNKLLKEISSDKEIEFLENKIEIFANVWDHKDMEYSDTKEELESYLKNVITSDNNEKKVSNDFSPNTKDKFKTLTKQLGKERKYLAYCKDYCEERAEYYSKKTDGLDQQDFLSKVYAAKTDHFENLYSAIAAKLMLFEKLEVKLNAKVEEKNDAKVEEKNDAKVEEKNDGKAEEKNDELKIAAEDLKTIGLETIGLEQPTLFGIEIHNEKVVKVMSDNSEHRVQDETKSKYEELKSKDSFLKHKYIWLKFKEALKIFNKNVVPVARSNILQDVVLTFAQPVLSILRGGDHTSAYNNPARLEAIKQASEEAGFTRGHAPGDGNNCFIHSLLQEINSANGVKVDDPTKQDDYKEWVNTLNYLAVQNGFNLTEYLGVSDLRKGAPDAKLRKDLEDNLDNHVLKIWVYNDKDKTLKNADIINGVNAGKNGIPVEINILYDRSHFDPLFKNTTAAVNGAVKGAENISKIQDRNPGEYSDVKKLSLEKIHTILETFDNVDIRKEMPLQVGNALNEFFQNGIEDNDIDKYEESLTLIKKKLNGHLAKIEKEEDLLYDNQFSKDEDGINNIKEVISEYYRKQTNEGIGQKIINDGASLDMLIQHFIGMQEDAYVKVVKALYRTYYDGTFIVLKRVVKGCEVNEDNIKQLPPNSIKAKKQSDRLELYKEIPLLKEVEKRISEFASSNVKEEMSPELVRELESYTEKVCSVEKMTDGKAFFEELKLIKGQLITIANANFWQYLYFTYKDQIEEKIVTNSKYNEKVALVEKLREKINNKINQIKQRKSLKEIPEILTELKGEMENLSSPTSHALSTDAIKTYARKGCISENVRMEDYIEYYNYTRNLDRELIADWEESITNLDDIENELVAYAKTIQAKVKECDEKINDLRMLADVKDVDEKVMEEFRNGNPEKEETMRSLVEFFKSEKKNINSEIIISSGIISRLTKEKRLFIRVRENMNIEDACDKAGFIRGLSPGSNRDCFLEAVAMAFSNVRGLNGSDAYANKESWGIALRDAAIKSGMRKYQGIAQYLFKGANLLTASDMRKIYEGKFLFQSHALFALKFRSILDKYVLSVWEFKPDLGEGKLVKVGEVKGENAGKKGEIPVSIDVLISPDHAEPLYPKNQGRMAGDEILIADGYIDAAAGLDIIDENDNENEISDDINGSEKLEEFTKIKDLQDQINNLEEWDAGDKYIEARNKLESYIQNGILSQNLYKKDNESVEKIKQKYMSLTKLISLYKTINEQEKEKYSIITFSNETELSKEFRQKFNREPKNLDELKKFASERVKEKIDKLKLLEGIGNKVKSEISICENDYTFKKLHDMANTKSKRYSFDQIVHGLKNVWEKISRAFQKVLSVFSNNKVNDENIITALNTRYDVMVDEDISNDEVHSNKNIKSDGKKDQYHELSLIAQDEKRKSKYTAEKAISFDEFVSLMNELEEMVKNENVTTGIIEKINRFYKYGCLDGGKGKHLDIATGNRYINALIGKTKENFEKLTYFGSEPKEDEIIKKYSQHDPNANPKDMDINTINKRVLEKYDEIEMILNKATARLAYDLAIQRSQNISDGAFYESKDRCLERQNVLLELIGELSLYDVGKKLHPDLIEELNDIVKNGCLEKNVMDWNEVNKKYEMIKKYLLETGSSLIDQFRYYEINNNNVEELPLLLEKYNGYKEKIDLIEKLRDKVNADIHICKEKINAEEAFSDIKQLEKETANLTKYLFKDLPNESQSYWLKFLKQGSFSEDERAAIEYYERTYIVDAALEKDWKQRMRILEGIKLDEDNWFEKKIADKINNDITICKKVQENLKIEKACKNAKLKRVSTPGNNSNCVLESITKAINRANGNDREDPRKAYKEATIMQLALRYEAVEMGFRQKAGFTLSQHDELNKSPKLSRNNSRNSDPELNTQSRDELLLEEVKLQRKFNRLLQLNLDNYILTVWEYNPETEKLVFFNEIKGEHVDDEGVVPEKINILFLPGHAVPVFPQIYENENSDGSSSFRSTQSEGSESYKSANSDLSGSFGSTQSDENGSVRSTQSDVTGSVKTAHSDVSGSFGSTQSDENGSFRSTQSDEILLSATREDAIKQAGFTRGIASPKGNNCLLYSIQQVIDNADGIKRNSKEIEKWVKDLRKGAVECGFDLTEMLEVGESYPTRTKEYKFSAQIRKNLHNKVLNVWVYYDNVLVKNATLKGNQANENSVEINIFHDINHFDPLFPKSNTNEKNNNTRGGAPASVYSDAARLEAIKLASRQLGFTRGKASGKGNNCFIQSLLQGIHSVNGIAVSDPKKAQEESAVWETILRDEAVVNGFEHTGYLGVSDLTDNTPDRKFRDQLEKNLDNYVVKIWRYNEQRGKLENVDIVNGKKAGESGASLEINMLYDNEHFDPLFKNNSNENHSTISEKSSLKIVANKFFNTLKKLNNGKNGSVKRTENVKKMQGGNREEHREVKTLAFEEIYAILENLDKLDIRKEIPPEVEKALNEYFQNGIEGLGEIEFGLYETRIVFVKDKLNQYIDKIEKEEKLLHYSSLSEHNRDNIRDVVFEYYRNQTNEVIPQKILKDDASLDVLAQHFLGMQEDAYMKVRKAIYRNYYEGTFIALKRIVNECEINERDIRRLPPNSIKAKKLISRLGLHKEIPLLNDLEKRISEFASSNVKDEMSAELVNQLEYYAEKISSVENIKDKNAFVEELKLIKTQLISIANCNFWQNLYFTYKDQLEEKIVTNSKYNEKITLVEKLREKINYKINQIKQQKSLKEIPEILTDLVGEIENLSLSTFDGLSTDNIKNYAREGCISENVRMTDYIEYYNFNHFLDQELIADWKKNVTTLDNIKNKLVEYVNLIKTKEMECDEKINNLARLTDVKSVDVKVMEEFRNSNPGKEETITNLALFFKSEKKRLKSEMLRGSSIISNANREREIFTLNQDILDIQHACDKENFTRGVSLGTNRNCFLEAVALAFSNARSKTGSDAYENKETWAVTLRDAAIKSGIRKYQGIADYLFKYTLTALDMQQIYEGNLRLQSHSLFGFKFSSILDKYVLSVWKFNSDLGEGKLERVGEVKGENAGKNGETPVSLDVLISPNHTEPLYPKNPGRKVGNEILVADGDIVVSAGLEKITEKIDETEILDELNGSEKLEEYTKIKDLENKINDLAELDAGDKYTEAKSSLKSYMKNGILNENIYKKDKESIEKIKQKYMSLVNLIALYKTIGEQLKHKYSIITFNNENELSEEFRHKFNRVPRNLDELKKFAAERYKETNDKLKLLDGIGNKVNSEISICEYNYTFEKSHDMANTKSKRSYFDKMIQGLKVVWEKISQAFQKVLSIFSNNKANNASITAALNTRYNVMADEAVSDDEVQSNQSTKSDEKEDQYNENSLPARIEESNVKANVKEAISFDEFISLMNELDEVVKSENMSLEILEKVNRFYKYGCIDGGKGKRLDIATGNRYINTLVGKTEENYNKVIYFGSEAKEDEIIKKYSQLDPDANTKDMDITSINLKVLDKFDEIEMIISKAIARLKYDVAIQRSKNISEGALDESAKSGLKRQNNLLELVGELVLYEVGKEIHPELMQELNDFVQNGCLDVKVKNWNEVNKKYEMIKKYLLEAGSSFIDQFRYYEINNNNVEELPLLLEKYNGYEEKIELVEKLRDKINADILICKEKVYNSEAFSDIKQLEKEAPNLIKYLFKDLPKESQSYWLKFLKRGSFSEDERAAIEYYEKTYIVDAALEKDWNERMRILEGIKLDEDNWFEKKIADKINNDISICKKIQENFKIEKACNNVKLKRVSTPGNNCNCVLESITKAINRANGNDRENPHRAYKEATIMQMALRYEAVEMGFRKRAGFTLTQHDEVSTSSELSRENSQNSGDRLNLQLHNELSINEANLQSKFSRLLKLNLDNYILTVWEYNPETEKLDVFNEIKGEHADDEGVVPEKISILFIPKHAEPLFPQISENENGYQKGSFRSANSDGSVSYKTAKSDINGSFRSILRDINGSFRSVLSDVIGSFRSAQSDVNGSFRRVQNEENTVVVKREDAIKQAGFTRGKASPKGNNCLLYSLQQVIDNADGITHNNKLTEKWVGDFRKIAVECGFDNTEMLEIGEDYPRGTKEYKFSGRIKELLKNKVLNVWVYYDNILVKNATLKGNLANENSAEINIFHDINHFDPLFPIHTKKWISLNTDLKEISAKFYRNFKTISLSVFRKNSGNENSNNTRGGAPASAFNEQTRIEAIKKASEEAGFTRGHAPGDGNNCFIQSLLQGIHHANGMEASDPLKAQEEAAEWEAILRDEAVVNGFERTGYLGVSDLIDGSPDKKFREQLIKNLDNYVLKIWLYNESSGKLEAADIVNGENALRNGTPVEINMLYDGSHFDPLFIKNTISNVESHNFQNTVNSPDKEAISFDELMGLENDFEGLLTSKNLHQEIIEKVNRFYKYGYSDDGKGKSLVGMNYRSITNRLEEILEKNRNTLNFFEFFADENQIVDEYNKYMEKLDNIDIDLMRKKIFEELEERERIIIKANSRVKYELAINQNENISNECDIKETSKKSGFPKLDKLQQLLGNLAKLEVGEKIPFELWEGLNEYVKNGSKDENVKDWNAVKEKSEMFEYNYLLSIADGFASQFNYYEFDNKENLHIIVGKYDRFREKADLIEKIRKQLSAEIENCKKQMNYVEAPGVIDQLENEALEFT